MSAERVSVSLPSGLIQFLEEYRAAHQRRTRSEVIEEALILLRERELEAAYRLAAEDSASDFEQATSDGLADEAW